MHNGTQYFMAAVGLASLGLAMSAAQADTRFNLTTGGGGIRDSTTGTLSWTAGEISLTVSGEYKPLSAGSSWTGTNAFVTQDQYGLGVLNPRESPIPDDPIVDNVGSYERLILSFNPAVDLQGMTFTFADVSDRAEVGVFSYAGDEEGTLVARFKLGTTTGEGDGTSQFTLTSTQLGPFVPNGQFYVAAVNVGSTGFRLASIDVNAAVVPLPTAVWSGMALMGMLGAGRLHKRLRSA